MKFCLGTVQMGMDYGISGGKQPNLATSLSLLNNAYHAGIRIFDTAAAYGSAEVVLGVFLRQAEIDIDQIRVVSKLPQGVFENSNKKSMLSIAEKYILNSLDQMGLAKIYGYMFHNAQYIFDDNAIYALDSLKQKKLVEKIGVSIYSPKEAMRALEIESIDIIQVPYNVLDKRLHNCGFFELAKEKGIEVFARSILLQGLLVMEERNIPNYMAFASSWLRRFKEICKEYESEPFVVAVKYVMNQPLIDYIVFGVDNEKQLEEYTKIERDIPNKLLTELNEQFKEVEERVLMPNLWRSDI